MLITTIMTDRNPKRKEDIMALNKKTDSELSEEMLKSAGDAAIQGLDDDMLEEVSGGKNIFQAGVDILSNRKVNRIFNVKGAVFADQVGRVLDAKKRDSKK